MILLYSFFMRLINKGNLFLLMKLGYLLIFPKHMDGPEKGKIVFTEATTRSKILGFIIVKGGVLGPIFLALINVIEKRKKNN